MAKPCESCLEAVVEEGAGEDIATECLALMGEDIADHLCDEIETEGEVVCGCPCKPGAKRQFRMRRAAAKTGYGTLTYGR